MKSEIRARFADNLIRVENLVAVYSKRAPGLQGRRPVTDGDLLRAAVVFLHATLEDLLRSVARMRLPHASGTILSSIPLLGHQGKGRLSFSLGDLAVHRGKGIQDLLEESIDAHLEFTTYNSNDDIARLLNDIGLDPNQFSSAFPDLQSLMKRRHHIVHRADARVVAGSGHHRARSISPWEVRKWASAVREFGTQLLANL